MKPVKLGLSAPLAFVALSLASAALLIVVAATARPAAADVSITFDELVFGPAGSVIEVEVVEVDAELVGMSCVLAVRSENQASVHIGNDLIVSTGDSQAVIVGVEDTANGGMSQTYDMVLGPQIRVEIRIGQDGMSSLGFGLSFECPDPTTTTVPPVSTTDTLPNPTLGGQIISTTTLVESVTTAPTVSVIESTTTGPTVAGAVIGLPETPPARAVIGNPTYTG